MSRSATSALFSPLAMLSRRSSAPRRHLLTVGLMFAATSGVPPAPKSSCWHADCHGVRAVDQTPCRRVRGQPKRNEFVTCLRQGPAGVLRAPALVGCFIPGTPKNRPRQSTARPIPGRVHRSSRTCVLLGPRGLRHNQGIPEHDSAPAGIPVVVPRGDLDAATVQPLIEKLESVGSRHSAVVLDAGGIGFANSSFLNVLLRLHGAGPGRPGIRQARERDRRPPGTDPRPDHLPGRSPRATR
ncbi:STAS domain-containing protein [Streptomyces sp. NPDC006333]|uniref:STAS domain-containing protein n=1 Tax=Streptomyces sp. NPDC006333 TaxID=3156753 RepID=UPI0033B089DB